MNQEQKTPQPREINPDNVGVIVVIGWHYWGKGKDLATAKKNWRAQGGRLSDGYTILEFDEVTEFKGVDDFSRYHWGTTDGSDPHDHAPKETDVAPRGKK